MSRPADGESSRVQESRIDPPHELVSKPRTSDDARSREHAGVASAAAAGTADLAGDPAPDPTAPDGPPPAPETADRHVQVQADQLASHLRERQRELDHREAQVNARMASIDRDTRAARLWLQEREAEAVRRSEALDQRESELEQREQEFTEKRSTTRHASADQLDARRREIDLAERCAQEAREEAEGLRDRLRQACREMDEDGRRQRRRLAAEQRAALAEIDKQRESLRRRGEHVDQCRAALEQLRAELGRMHRETLEIRLATEELWAQLSGAAPPAALTSSLSGIRSKLADHYRLANAEVQEQKQELEAIRRQLSDQYNKVVRQKERYDRWVEQQRQEAATDASRLAAREAELHQLEAELNDRALQWQAQRLDYEQQIRRLQAQDADCEPATA